MDQSELKQNSYTQIQKKGEKVEGKGVREQVALILFLFLITRESGERYYHQSLDPQIKALYAKFCG